jgi:hypothetical protein
MGSQVIPWIVAAAVAVGALLYAVAEAAMTLEPWGDSPRIFYAALSCIGLAVGTGALAFSFRSLRNAAVWPRLPLAGEVLVYAGCCIAIGAPLAIAASNSLAASSVGQGGPAFVVQLVGGIGLAAGLALLMGRRITLGLITSGVLGAALLLVALVTAR